MELNNSDAHHFNKFELPDLSRRSERKHIKIPQKNGSKKLPRCFSIPDEEVSSTRKMSTNNNFKNTIDAGLRKIHSEQVSPRAQPNAINVKTISIKSSKEDNSKNWQCDQISISKNEWNDSTRFAPIISSILL